MALFANKSRRRGSAWALGEVEQRALPLQVQPGSPYSAFGAANWPYSPYSERPSSSGADGAPLSAEAALRIADVWACVRVLADAASSLPLRAYRRSGQDRAPYAGALAGLLARPAPASTLADLVSTIVAHLNLHGNAYLGKYRDAQGRVEQIVPLPPTAITPGLDAGEPFYLLSTPSGTTRHSTADITHIRGLSLDGIVGLSPLGAARAVSLSSSLAEHADAFARGGARVGGILSAPNVTNPESLQRMAVGWGETHGHVDQSGKIAVVAGEIRVS